MTANRLACHCCLHLHAMCASDAGKACYSTSMLDTIQQTPFAYQCIQTSTGSIIAYPYSFWQLCFWLQVALLLHQKHWHQPLTAPLLCCCQMWPLPLLQTRPPRLQRISWPSGLTTISVIHMWPLHQFMSYYHQRP